MELREKIADVIFSFRWFFSNNRDDALDLADKILKLIEQEYEPVQLEALTDEEFEAMGYDKDFDTKRAISQATIAKNQKLGQLYRRKET